MNKLYKYSTLFLSYSPLWFSIIFVDAMSVFYDKTSYYWTEIIGLILIIIGYIISIPNVVMTLIGINVEGAETCTIKHAKEDKTVAVEYLLSFILPMFAFDFTQWRQVVLFLIYFAVLVILCVRHNLLVSNVVLIVRNYRIYHVVVVNSYGIEIERDVLSRDRLTDKLNEDIIIHSMNNDLYYDVTHKQIERRENKKVR